MTPSTTPSEPPTRPVDRRRGQRRRPRLSRRPAAPAAEPSPRACSAQHRRRAARPAGARGPGTPRRRRAGPRRTRVAPPDARCDLRSPARCYVGGDRAPGGSHGTHRAAGAQDGSRPRLDVVRRARRRRGRPGPPRDPDQLDPLRGRRSRPTSPRRRWPTRPRPRRTGRGPRSQTAVERVEAELRRTAEDGDLVVAVTDPDTRILWTYGGRVMRRKAETVNFVAGGRWDDESVGTNALDLANRTDRPEMVFSAEHYASIVHNWVCWAAPVHDPVTGAQLGVIDLSTTWDRTHPIGLATARVMARLIETAMPPRPTSPVRARRDRRARAGDAAARHRRDLARRPAAAAQPAPDRDPRAARDAPRGPLPRAPARAGLRRPGGDHLDAQGRGLAPALRARRPARLASLPADDAGLDRRRPRAHPAAPRPGRAPPSTPTAATCCPAPTRRRSPSWPSTSRSPSARRCSPTPTRTPCSATASWRPTTPRSSRSASPACPTAHPAVPLLKGRLGRRLALSPFCRARRRAWKAHPDDRGRRWTRQDSRAGAGRHGRGAGDHGRPDRRPRRRGAGLVARSHRRRRAGPEHRAGGDPGPRGARRHDGDRRTRPGSTPWSSWPDPGRELRGRFAAPWVGVGASPVMTRDLTTGAAGRGPTPRVRQAGPAGRLGARGAARRGVLADGRRHGPDGRRGGARRRRPGVGARGRTARRSRP